MNTKNVEDVQSKMVASYLFAQAFAQSRDLRSQAYKDGVLAAVSRHVIGTDIRCTFALGSAENDAFFAGTAEGHAIAKRYRDGELVVPSAHELPRKVAQLSEKIRLDESFSRRSAR